MSTAHDEALEAVKESVVRKRPFTVRVENVESDINDFEYALFDFCSRVDRRNPHEDRYEGCDDDDAEWTVVVKYSE